MDDRPTYREVYEAFDPVTLFDDFDDFDGDMGTAVNACIECCDRHVGHSRVALQWANASGDRAAFTFEELQSWSAQVANLLTAHGIGPGDVVAGLLPRVPELVAVVLGALRAGAAYQPLFTAFGPSAIEQRLSTSQAKVVVTDGANRSKLDAVANTPLVMTLNAERDGDVDFIASAAAMSDAFTPVMQPGTAPMFMMSTSGTTGLPKGVQVPIKFLAGIQGYMRYAIDLQPDDVFWNMADPGWAYGLYDGVIGGLLLGHQITLYDGPFSVESTISLVQELDVTNFAGAPTAYRMIIAAGPGAASELSGRFRVASSAGEPLNPEVMRWFKNELGCELYDHYGQTECGMVLANHHGLAHHVLPGSAGLPLPGFRVAVLDEEGRPVAPGTPGVLAVHRRDSPCFFFDGYKGTEGQGWVGEYYLTGDTVEENENGSIGFVGRNDDVISSAGYRIGPFDVESCLLEHDAVAESAAVGKPDEQRGEIVKAFVVLHPRYVGDHELKAELSEHVRNRLGKHAFPREIAFVEALPKTPSGKIQRFLLRNE